VITSEEAAREPTQGMDPGMLIRKGSEMADFISLEVNDHETKMADI
jgi:hypothetical protein